MILRFKTVDLAPLIEHARNSKKFANVLGYEGIQEPGLLLVKDSGAYLMSNGNPGQPRTDDQKGRFAIYAEGCLPENGHIGGDDFVELFTLVELEDFLKCDIIQFELTGNTIDIKGFDKPRPKTRRKN